MHPIFSLRVGLNGLALRFSCAERAIYKGVLVHFNFVPCHYLRQDPIRSTLLTEPSVLTVCRFLGACCDGYNRFYCCDDRRCNNWPVVVMPLVASFCKRVDDRVLSSLLEESSFNPLCCLWLSQGPLSWNERATSCWILDLHIGGKLTRYSIDLKIV